MLKNAKEKIMNFANTSCQKEMENILRIFYSRVVFHA